MLLVLLVVALMILGVMYLRKKWMDPNQDESSANTLLPLSHVHISNNPGSSAVINDPESVTAMNDPEPSSVINDPESATVSNDSSESSNVFNDPGSLNFSTSKDHRSVAVSDDVTVPW